MKDNKDIKEMIDITDSWALMNVYSLVRDKFEIKKAMEYFVNHICETEEPEIVSAMSSAFI